MRNFKDTHNKNHRANQQDSHRRTEIRVEGQQSGSQARAGTVGTEFTTSVSEGQTKASIPGHIGVCKCSLDLHNCRILTIMQWRENFVIRCPVINCGNSKW